MDIISQMDKVRALLFIITAITVLTGCATQKQIVVVERVCLPGTAKAQIVAAAEDLLGEMHFSVAKADIEQGYVRTRPLRAAQFFEFWRRDNVGSANSAEANLHSLRRVVELDISEQAGQMCVGCEVSVQRLSLAEHEVSSSTRAYEMFTKSKRTIQNLRIESRKKEWVDLGDDKQLATVILNRLERQIAKQQKEKNL